MSNNAGKALARSREMFVAREGTWVALNTGVKLKALIKHSDHDLLRMTKSDDDEEKKPVVFIFGGSAWGQVLGGTVLTVGGPVPLAGMHPTPAQPHVPTVDMSRSYRVNEELHPKWRQGVVTELAVVGYLDI